MTASQPRCVEMKKTVTCLVLSVLCGAWLAPPGMAQPLAFQDSPFGVYSPYGEFLNDKGTYATIDDISAYLQDIGVAWVQELPFVRYGDIPQAFQLYSRVGREGGMQPSRVWDTTYRAQYQTALRQSVRNNKDRAKYWELDTEPDGIGGWSSDPQGYVELLKITRTIFREECADCKLIFGGLSGGTDALNTQGNAFMEKALAAGAAGYFDGLEFKWHHMAARDYRLIKNKFDGLGSTLSQYGVDILALPVFVEGAQYDGDPNQPVPRSSLPIQTEREQAWGLLKMYVYGLSIGIDKIFWNLLFERSDYEPGHTEPFAQNPFNHYGLIHNPTNADGLSGKKLSYYTYKKMVEIMEGSDWTGIQTIQEAGDVYVYKFSRNGTPVYVAWWDYFNYSTYTPGKTMPVTVIGLTGNTALATDAVPPFSSGAEVTNYTTAFRQQTLAVTGGTVTLQLGESPVFVEGPAVSLRVNGNPNVTVIVSNPVTVDYTLRGGQDQEFFLVLDAPAMGILLSYRNTAGQWVPLPANLADITSFTTAPVDGDHTLYTGTAPAGAYSLCLGYDTVSNGHLNLEAAVYDCAMATVR